MSIKVENYTVTVEVQCTVPASFLRDLIEEHRNPDSPSGINKIYAIKELREWIDDRYDLRLSLKDAKDLIEAELKA